METAGNTVSEIDPRGHAEGAVQPAVVVLMQVIVSTT